MKEFLDFASAEIDTVFKTAKCVSETAGSSSGSMIRDFELDPSGFNIFDRLKVRSFANEKIHLELWHDGSCSKIGADKFISMMSNLLGEDSNSQDVASACGVPELNGDYCWYFNKYGEVLDDGEDSLDVWFGVLLRLREYTQTMTIIHFQRFPKNRLMSLIRKCPPTT